MAHTVPPPRPRRPAVQRVNVDFPRPLLEAIDAEAARLAIPRQAFIKLRLADTLTGWHTVVRGDGRIVRVTVPEDH